MLTKLALVPIEIGTHTRWHDNRFCTYQAMNKNGRRTVYKRIMELCGERLWTIDAKYVRIARCLCEARLINLPEGVVWLPVEAYTPSSRTTCSRDRSGIAPATIKLAGFISRLPSPSTTTVGNPVANATPVPIETASPIEPVI